MVCLLYKHMCLFRLSSDVHYQASLLRSIVAGPRSRHPEAGLDLCYVTDNSKSPVPFPFYLPPPPFPFQLPILATF